MSLVSPSQANPGDELTAQLLNDPHNQIATVINGNLDDTNISGISGTKIQAGTLPASALTTDANPETRMSESLGDFVASGCIWSSASGLNGAMTSGVVYINGKRLTVAAIPTRAFTANRDTYVAIDVTGTPAYIEVTNNAAGPSLPANSVWVAVVITNASTVTACDDLAIRDTKNSVLARRLIGSDRDVISINAFPPKRYLRVIFSYINSGSVETWVRVNNDSATNYYRRWSLNGGAQTTSPSSTVFVGLTPASNSGAGEFNILNNTVGTEKYMSGMAVVGTTNGAANTPNTYSLFAKWTNTASQITRIDIINNGTGDFAAGSELTVEGYN